MKTTGVCTRKLALAQSMETAKLSFLIWPKGSKWEENGNEAVEQSHAIIVSGVRGEGDYGTTGAQWLSKQCLER